jgi:hypothetical protein
MLEKWRYNYLLLLALLILVSSAGFSETLCDPFGRVEDWDNPESSSTTRARCGVVEQPPSLSSKLFSALKSSGVATVSLGPAFARPGHTQTFNLTPTIRKTYVADTSSQALLDGQFFLGIHKQVRSKLKGQVGLVVATTSKAYLLGHIWDDADPEFDNYTYVYKSRFTHVGIKGKLLLEKGYVVTPWVSGSMGVSFNQSYAFTNDPLIFEAVVMPNFATNITVGFSYTLGVGIQRPLSKNFQVGIGYEFSDWGMSNLNRAFDQTLNRGLSLPPFRTNALLLSLTYSV